jgi:hypothetical protein
MAYTVTELITRSFYLSEIVSRGFETPTGEQLSDGLYLLNALLDTKTFDQRLIPYFSRYTSEFIPNQEKYNIPNLVEIETFSFNYQSVRYPLLEATRDQYFGSYRVNNLSSFPFMFHQERLKGGSDVYIYFIPQTNYTYEIWGKFSLTNVTLGDDLSLLYDNFYIEYLRYELAQMLCQEYGLIFDPTKEKRLNQYRNQLNDLVQYDLTINKLSTFSSGEAYNWAQVNIGQGYSPT